MFSGVQAPGGKGVKIKEYQDIPYFHNVGCRDV